MPVYKAVSLEGKEATHFDFAALASDKDKQGPGVPVIPKLSQHRLAGFNLAVISPQSNGLGIAVESRSESCAESVSALRRQEVRHNLAKNIYYLVASRRNEADRENEVVITWSGAEPGFFIAPKNMIVSGVPATSLDESGRLLLVSRSPNSFFTFEPPANLAPANLRNPDYYSYREYDVEKGQPVWRSLALNDMPVGPKVRVSATYVCVGEYTIAAKKGQPRN